MHEIRLDYLITPDQMAATKGNRGSVKGHDNLHAVVMAKEETT